MIQASKLLKRQLLFLIVCIGIRSLAVYLAKISNFPPEIAAGIVLIGCSPSGVASNVMAYLAKANLALSITITSYHWVLLPGR